MKTTILSTNRLLLTAYSLLLSTLCSLSMDLTIESTGAEALRKGNFQQAIAELLKDASYTDTAMHLFKLGMAYEGADDVEKAYRYYLSATKATDTLITPFIYEKIGDVEEKRGRIENSLKAYRAALDDSRRQRYAHHLYGKMYRLVTHHSEEIGGLAWLEDIIGPPPAGVEIEMEDELERFIEENNWTAIDSVVENLLDTSSYNQTHCDVAKRLIDTPLPDTVITTKALYRLSKIASLCGSYKASSDWLLEALSRPDFKEFIPDRNYMYHRAQLNYNLGNSNNSIRWFKKYEKEYGPTPDLVYMMARNYRTLGNASQATQWYDRHIKLYPKHIKSHDILWYRAWQKEETGDYAGARKLYREVYKQHKGRKRADDSFFRAALSYIKDEKVSLALASFETFLQDYSNSSLRTAAEFWKAKCHLIMDNHEEAKKAFAELQAAHPTDYYGYRSREKLQLMGDTTTLFTIDTVYDLEKAALWLDSTSNGIKEELKPEDSLALLLGRVLGSVGMNEHAEFFLEPVEICYPGNLLLQLQLASFYGRCGSPTLSYRVTRRLAWRIPEHARLSMPLPLYTIIYPLAFIDEVERQTFQFQVAPELVLGIMKQESMFNPSVVSPVGAIGLMQVMPYTGEEIAQDLKIDSFEVKDLYDPPTSIRFGAYYISKLLKQFKGNFVLATASYNGGPHNVKKWYERNKEKDFDMFIEDIGFTETRGYVKKVLANYWTYQHLNRARKIAGL